MSEEVKAFKVVSGEEVLGRIVEDKTDSYIVKSPRAIMIQPGPNGQVGITLIPLFASSQDGEIEIKKSHIIGEASKVSADLEKGYLEQTSGIALA